MTVHLAKAPGTRRPPVRRGGGFALPVVLLLLAVMSVLALKLVDQSRGDLAQARALQREAQARHAADAGYAQTVARYVAERGHGPAGLDTRLGPARVSVVVVPEDGKIDLNAAGPELIAGILRVVGVEQDRAEALAAAVVAIRSDPADPLLHGADDLLRVPGISPDLPARLRPYVTVWRGASGIDLGLAPPEVLRALPGITDAAVARILAARAGEAPLAAEDRDLVKAHHRRGRGLVTIRATATLDDGATFTREAVVDLRNRRAPLVLSWLRADGADVPLARGAE